MTQISQSQVNAFSSTNVSPVGDAKQPGVHAHEALASLAAADLPVLNSPRQVYAYAVQADRGRYARHAADAPPAPIELKGEGSVFTDATDANHNIQDTGVGSQITLGRGDNQVGLQGWLAKLNAGDGNNIIDATKGKYSNVTLGNGNNHYTGPSKSLTLGDGNNVVAGEAYRVRVGNGNNQLTGSFPSALQIGNGNNDIRITGGAGPITLGSGSNTIDAGGMSSSMLHLKSNGSDTRVTNLTKDMSVQFGAGATPDKVSVSRIGNDLVAATSGSTEKLTVAGYYGLASPPYVTLHAGGSAYSVTGAGTMPSTWSRG